MNQASNQPYDARYHITARQLRRLGFYLSEMVPDEAFVRRVAVGLDNREPLNDGSPTWGVRVLEPFKVSSPELCFA